MAESSLDSSLKEGEEGEILEEGEIYDDEVVEAAMESQVVDQPEETSIEQIVTIIGEDINESDDNDDSKKHKKSNHRKRRRRHDDHKSDEKKSRHKKRKGDEESHGNETPPTKKKKKRRKHGKDKKERDSSSPDIDNFGVDNMSESPPLPSEQNNYHPSTFESSNAYSNSGKYSSSYDISIPYNGGENIYSYEKYQVDVDYSSGSDSCYSDFESHLKQYQSYKLKQDPKLETAIETSEDDDLDNYYSVGYDAEKRRKRQLLRDDSKPTKSSNYQGKTSSNTNGESSSYKNQTTNRRNRNKFQELCHHYYVNGSCPEREKCNYMHEEYPCKWFHTGTECINKENCKFSHEPANEETKRIIKQFQDACNSFDDTKEIEALEKAGIKPLQKPPPGMGLLPTPPPDMALVSSKISRNKNKSTKSAIPSLFDINVLPTPELQEKINTNSVPSLKHLDDELTEDTSLILSAVSRDFGLNQSNSAGGLLPIPNINLTKVRVPLLSNMSSSSGLLGTSPKQPAGLLSTPSQLKYISPHMPPESNGTPPWILHQQSLLKQEQKEIQPMQEALYGYSASNHAPETASNNETNHLRLHRTTSHITDLKPVNKLVDIRDNSNKSSDDVIRMPDDDQTDYNRKENDVHAPDFLPPKQKALFMRIHQKGTLPSRTTNNPKWNSYSDVSSENWTYSSDEEDKIKNEAKEHVSISQSTHSVMQMINPKTKQLSVIETNLIPKIPDKNSVDGELSARKHSELSSVSEPLIENKILSPRHSYQSSQTRERKISDNDVISNHYQSFGHSLRRRLSTSELNKEPVTIPLVSKLNTDSFRTTHPDPRLTLSKLFGKTMSNFRASVPVFGKDITFSDSVKLSGLKITLSSSDSLKNKLSASKRIDSLSLSSNSRHNVGDPCIKNKPNDPRLRARATSITKTSPPSSGSSLKSASIPPKPTALLTKPATSVIPSLPELNLDLANFSSKKQSSTSQSSPPVSSSNSGSFSRIPKLLRGNVRSVSNPVCQTNDEKQRTKKINATTIAPYDPRYISSRNSSSAAELSSSSIAVDSSSTITTTSTSLRSAPYDPRVISTQLFSVPPLLDARSTSQENNRKLPQLPKLTPAPGYAAKLQEANERNKLPTEETCDF